MGEIQLAKNSKCLREWVCEDSHVLKYREKCIFKRVFFITLKWYT